MDAHPSTAATMEPNRTAQYVLIFGVLVALTAVICLPILVPGLELPVFARRLFLLAVAVVQGLLVVLFYMHLKWEANWKYVLTIPSLFMSLCLVVGLIPDIGLRRNAYAEERRNAAAEAQPWLPPTAHSK